MENPVAKLSQLYPTMCRKKRECRQVLEDLESRKEVSLSTQQYLEGLLKHLHNLLYEAHALLDLALSALDPSSKDLWERRLKTFSNDVDAIKKAGKHVVGVVLSARGKEHELRVRLMGNAVLETTAEADDQSSLGALENERRQLMQTSDVLTSILNQGQHIVSSLAGQNVTLKGAQKKVLDFQSSLGFSTTLIKLIHRRHTTDRLLVYTGMVVTVTLLIICYYLLFVHYPGHTVSK